jgi:predicted RNA-binding protein with PUA-like domain
MKPGDLCFFYHSSCKVPSIVGTCRVVRDAQPDPTAVDPNHKGYDAKSTPDNNRWVSVMVEFEELYETPITIQELRAQATTNPILADLMLLKQSRLSVMPVTKEQWRAVLTLQRHKEQGQDLLHAATAATTTPNGKKDHSAETKCPLAKRKRSDSRSTKERNVTEKVDDPNYCSNPENALSVTQIQAIQSDTANKITEKDLGLKGRKHLYTIDTNNGNLETRDLVVYYDGSKFIGKDLERMNTLVAAAKGQQGNKPGNVYLLLSPKAGICKRNTLPLLISYGAIVQRV